LSESELTKFENLQNKVSGIMAIFDNHLVSFQKSSNPVNFDSDKKISCIVEN